ncbi:uncharacterized protein LOC141659023 [Apium graveolens]|uniref:uncharacterized protein LOC141659023 n=1 Tax=Apium graveolens TaxID=4045 RepID=UPI003D7BAB5B
MDINKIKGGGSIGLSYHMLTKGNYTTWALKMKVYLQAQGVWIVVEQIDPKTVVDDKVDKIALAMLYQGLPEEMILSIAEKGTTKEAWTALKTMCQGADRAKKAKVQTLRTEFESLVMKDNEQIDEFYLKLNGLVINIRALGEPITESYMDKKMLRAVPTRFLQIVSTLEQFGDLEKITLEEIVSSLKIHEERLGRSNKSELNDGQLMLIEEEWQKREAIDSKLLLTREEWQKRSSRRNSVGSFPNTRPRGGRDKKCKRPRRNKEVKEEMNMARLEDNEPALLLAKCEDDDNKERTHLNEKRITPSKFSKVQNESNVWYLDNGASSHMTGFKSKFMELDEPSTWLETASGKRYFLLLVDDFSRYMWVYFLKANNDVLDAFKEFCFLVERVPERKVRTFRTDRGGEFVSNDFERYCKENGIERHYTTPYNPQQNGVVERRNRTVVEMARFCLKETKLPSIMWVEAVRHSVYLLNHLPTRVLTKMTPCEAWNGKKPHIGHVKVFGCIGHIKIPNQHTQKLDDRSKQVVNLGKDPGTKSYRLYDPLTNRIHVSSDVTFEENESWPWDLSENEK